MHSIAKTRLVQGVGINDSDYVVAPSMMGKQVICPFYSCWSSMIKRCYSAKYQASFPTYIGCKVCDEWHYFMAFRAWMSSQDWEGKQLDKDLAGCGKLYSPENCVFISSSLNSLFTDCGASKGEFPIGVYWHKQHKKFHAVVSVKGKQKSLGDFISPSDAHEAWIAAKIEIAKGFLANETNPRIRYAIECGIAKLDLLT